MASITVSKNAQACHPLLDLGSGAMIDDVFTTDDEDKPISGGIFTVRHHDTPFVYKYSYAEVKVMLSGTIVLEDVSTGIKIVAVAGDVLKINKDTEVTFSSPDFGVAFYAGQRAYRKF